MQLTMSLRREEVPRVKDALTTLRHLSRQDVAAAGSLYFRSYPLGTVADEDEAIADVLAALDGEYGDYRPDLNLVCDGVDGIVGCIMGVDSPPWPDVSDQVFIIDLFVDPRHRGQGIGRELLSAFITNTPEGRAIGLRVDSDNHPAIALYESVGFRSVASSR
ncbi:GNAT family N-acetyltransferase [Actinomyces urogenitalis]|uniref:GNAT family N-acetyltransferase n=1 Tax=Actinomyces urogenitalis TaxID=103621 RepID=UPI001E47F0FD|nr:GNAT family N-acetyltransferase [Actinomyces urogenitalis]